MKSYRHCCKTFQFWCFRSEICYIFQAKLTMFSDSYYWFKPLRTSVAVENAIDGRTIKSQVETDDLYVGLNEHGAHYVLPV